MSKLEFLDIFDVGILASYDVRDGEKKLYYEKFDEARMLEMRIDTRPSFPSDKTTFSLANITRHRNIRYFSAVLQSNMTFDLEVLLEDSFRNSLNWLFNNS